MGRARGQAHASAGVPTRRRAAIDAVELRLLTDPDPMSAMLEAETFLRYNADRLQEPLFASLADVYLAAVVEYETVEGSIENAARQLMYELDVPGYSSDRLVVEPSRAR